MGIYYSADGTVAYSSDFFEPRTPSPPAPTPSPSDCKDQPSDWRSSEGDKCSVYESKKYCSSEGTTGSGWNADWGPITDYADDNGISALGACCACGGGSSLGVVV